jgi:PAS domain S-box-containing protein
MYHHSGSDNSGDKAEHAVPAPDLEALFDGLLSAAAILDGQGRIQRLNRAARSLCCASAPDAINGLLCEAPWWDRAADRAAVRRSIERAIADARREVVEVQARLPDDRIRTLTLTVRPLADASGAERLLIAETIDVTEQREGEAALHAALAQQRSVLDCILHPLVIIDASGIIQSCSRAMTRVFGYEPQELIGQNVSMLMPEPHRSAHDGYLAAYRRTGRTHILDRPREFEAVRKDGSRFSVELNVTRADVPGQPLPLFAGLMRDLTPEKRATAEIQERDRRLRSMLESASLVAVMLDARGCITFTNDAFLTLTGWKRHEVIGEDWFCKFLPADDRDRVRGVFKDAIHTRRIVTPHENSILTRSGAMRIIQWNNTVLESPEHDGAIGVAAIGVDVTDQRRAEAELRAHRERLAELVRERTAELEMSHEQLRIADRLASIGTLAAGVGHDTANIIFPTICRLEVVETGVTEPRLRKELREIRAALEYLRRLADGLHLLAMDPDRAGEEGKGESPLNLASWWEEAEPLMRRGAGRRDALNASIPDDLAPVTISSHRLTQAIFNLVVNAADAIDASGHIWLTARAVDPGAGPDAGPDAGKVAICVRDDGCGMTEEVRRRALDPFFTTRKRGLGTGLGLSLAHAVARGAGGALELESKPGAGTTVTLTLPVASPAGEAARRTAVLTVAEARSRAFITSLLAAAGVEAVAAHGPPNAPDGIWVADATDDALRRARAYLLGGPSRRVVLIGADGEKAPAPPGCRLVGTIGEVERLRQALSEATAAAGP